MKKAVCYAVALAVLMALAMSAQASLTPTLAWDQSITPGVTGNKIYYGTSSGNYSVEVDLGLATTYTLPLALNPSTNWYFVVTAYNNEAENNESDPSNEIHFSTFDTDGDGLLDGDETHIFGTSTILSDTDGDGYTDGYEIFAGLNPLDGSTVVHAPFSRNPLKAIAARRMIFVIAKYILYN